MRLRLPEPALHRGLTPSEGGALGIFLVATCPLRAQFMGTLEDCAPALFPAAVLSFHVLVSGGSVEGRKDHVDRNQGEHA